MGGGTRGGRVNPVWIGRGEKGRRRRLACASACLRLLCFWALFFFPISFGRLLSLF
jgi:hypothetical protein